jgi:putative spermidine/putrescine transport system permease protein
VASEVAIPNTGPRLRVGGLWRGRVNGWTLLLVPPLAYLCVVVGYPLLTVLQQSVTEPTTGLGNYEKVFGTGIYVDALIRTFRTSALVTVLCLVCGYPYAYLMTVVGPTWRRVLIFVVLVPLWTSLLIRTYAWTVLLQDTGLINTTLINLGLIDEPLHLIRTQIGVLIGMSQVLLPFMVLPLYANMRGIDPSFMKAAANLGARPATAFRRVYLPLTRPGAVAGALIVFIYALGFYITPALLGGPRDAMLSQLIVLQVSQLLDFGLGSAMAGVLLVVTLLLVAILARFVRPTTGKAAR